jgi:hypothetical protein
VDFEFPAEAVSRRSAVRLGAGIDQLHKAAGHLRTLRGGARPGCLISIEPALYSWADAGPMTANKSGGEAKKERTSW